MYIMVVGPYRSGAHTNEEREKNLSILNDAGLQVFKKGHCPVIAVNMILPLINKAGNEFFDEIMKPISAALALKCDGALRLGGPSQGADIEMEKVRANGGRIFNSIDEIPSNESDQYSVK